MVRVNNGGPLSLNEEMDELETIVADRIGRLKAAIKDGEAAVADEARQTEQFVENLKVRVAVLEAELKETEETVRRKDLSRQQSEESLSAKIHALENDAKEREEALTARAKEISDLKSTLDGQAKQIDHLESALEKAKQETASQATRAASLAESSHAKIAALEGQLREKEDLARQKESALKGLEQKLAARVRDFDNLAKAKEELVAGRDAEINDLNSQLKLLTKRMAEMSAFFRQAQALAAIEEQDARATGAKEVVDERDEKPVAVQANSAKVASIVQQEKPVVEVRSNAAKVMPVVAHTEGQIVAPDVFQCISGELAEFAGLMGPLAALIVREHVEGLGESMEKFPEARIQELLESVAKEISDADRQSDFRERLAHNVQISLNRQEAGARSRTGQDAKFQPTR
jgi:chromosome segregation ATPase